MDGGQVAVNRHSSEDIDASGLAVGTQGSDDGAHCLSKVPGSVPQQLVDEEGHAQEEKQVYHGETDDDDVWDATARARFL